MARLSTGDLVALLHVVDDLSGKVTTYSDIDLGRGVPIEASDQSALLECTARDRFARFMHEHPLIRPHLVRAVAITRLVAQLVDALVSPFTRSEDSAVDGLVAIDRAGRTRLMTTRPGACWRPTLAVCQAATGCRRSFVRGCVHTDVDIGAATGHARSIRS